MKKQYIYSIISVILWSTLAAFTKSLLGSVPNFQVIFLCSFIAFLFLLAVNIFTGNIKKLRELHTKDVLKMALLGVIGLFLYLALYNVGLSKLTSQQACVVNYLWPIMTVIFSCIILKERLNIVKGAAMLCSFIGIVILSGGISASGGGKGAVIGVLGCFIAAACYGCYSVLNKRESYDLKISMMIAWLTSALLALPIGLIFEEWVPVSGVQWLGFIWLGVLGDGLAYLTWAIALQGVRNTASIANLAYLTPFLSLIVSAVVLKEKIDVTAIIALVFIVGGILMQGILTAKISKRKIKCMISKE